ncbi:PREDICTED: TOM1-like protein 2 [Ceratosolen solmsi marchali]|uniref:TOM1-like protein 2 n=1 Tax=Ceratosolen solmsi marchali TaxID=326594 RepID=A0AAJ7DXC5_9HYME|nr:PREDICTED: TOM1-like protein 2 [Ceratosolen solmsi marchali]
MSFFGVNVTNPFTSVLGQKIEQATDANLPSENWALNMEICDMINETEDGPRDAVKAIKRRLSQAAGKNYIIVMYTLIVLETCVKNCGKRFHVLACSKEFALELVKLIGPKNDPPTIVQEKVLNLIQTWADTFRNQPHTQGIVHVYQELKTKGIEFPCTDLDTMAPIITPERSVPELEGSIISGAAAAEPTSTSSLINNVVIGQPMQTCHCPSGTQAVRLSEQHLLKLRGELDVVHGNMRVLSEMLATHSVGLQEKTSEHVLVEDMELLGELHDTCKAMQERVIELIGKLAHDELTAELLQINDEMNNLFLRYVRFTKNQKVPTSAMVAEAIGTGPTTSRKKLDSGDALIDLSDDEIGATALPIVSLIKRVDDLDLAGESNDIKLRRKEGEGDEFEVFAQSRTTSFDAIKNRQELQRSDNETEPSSSRTKNLMDKTVTSSEFERFLAERTAAAAIDVAPSTSNSTATGSTIQRQIGSDSEDKSLFAL